MRKTTLISTIFIMALFFLVAGCSLSDGEDNSRFVAVGGNGHAMWSDDGSAGSWTASSPGGNHLYGIAFRP